MYVVYVWNWNELNVCVYMRMYECIHAHDCICNVRLCLHVFACTSPCFISCHVYKLHVGVGHLYCINGLLHVQWCLDDNFGCCPFFKRLSPFACVSVVLGSRSLDSFSRSKLKPINCTMGCAASQQAVEPTPFVPGAAKEESSIVAPSIRRGKKQTCKDDGTSSSDWMGLALVHRTLWNALNFCRVVLAWHLSCRGCWPRLTLVMFDGPLCLYARSVPFGA